MKLLKRLLIIIPVVGLILVSIFMPVRQVSIEGIGTLSFETTITLSVGAEVAHASPDWLSGWAKRVKLTIDAGDIVSNLSNFPILVYLSTSSGRGPDDVTFVFDELQNDANRQKIAVTESDGTTQCYVEIERWDDASEEAWLWVTVPTIASDADTELYLYYDNLQVDNTGYVGDTGDAVAQNVWDANFKMVQHLKDLTTSTTNDSTSNNNDGTKWAADQPIEVDAKIGKGQDFTPGAYGTPSQYLQIGTTGFSASSGTLEAWVKAEGFVTADPAQYLFGHTVTPGWSQRIQLYTDDILGNLNLGLGDSHTRALDIQALNTATWYHIVLTWDGTNYVVYVDSVSKVTGTYTGLTSIQSLADIGNTGETTQRWEAWDGIIDEVRVSNTPRSAAWIEASYETGIDDLLDFGGEEPDIFNAPSSKDFGTVSESSDYWAYGGTTAPSFPLGDGECHFTMTNNGSDPVDILIRATDFSGGTPGWALDASPGPDTVTLKVGKVGDEEVDLKTLTTIDQAFITALGASSSMRWELKMETPTSFSNADQKTSTITLTATAS